MFIDTHCHLNFPQYDPDRAMVIGNAKKAGVKLFINPGVGLFSSQQAIALSQKHPGVIFAGVGFHPYEAQKLPDVSSLEKFFQSSITNHQSPIVAIGECGLDYHQYNKEAAEGKKTNQKRAYAENAFMPGYHGQKIRESVPLVSHEDGKSKWSNP